MYTNRGFINTNLELVTGFNNKLQMLVALQVMIGYTFSLLVKVTSSQR
jgi:hypothetical protein